MFSVYEGSLIIYTVLRFFSLCFTGVKKMVCFDTDLAIIIEDHYIVVPLLQAT